MSAFDAQAEVDCLLPILLDPDRVPDGVRMLLSIAISMAAAVVVLEGIRQSLQRSAGGSR